MEYRLLLQLRKTVEEKQETLPLELLKKIDHRFNVEYAHNSTAIEGNTLTLVQTKAIIEEGFPKGENISCEIYEVFDHAKAFAYMQKCVEEWMPLDENIVKDIHELLMENILAGGFYRNVEVRITGAGHKPPTPSEMYRQVKAFFEDLPYRTDLNVIELAAWTHAEFVRIHPFTDGNGRTSRMIMNYQLMSNGFLPISIAKENRLEYFEALESYAVDGDLTPFAEMIAELEKQRLEEYIAISEEQELDGSSQEQTM